MHRLWSVIVAPQRVPAQAPWPKKRRPNAAQATGDPPGSGVKDYRGSGGMQSRRRVLLGTPGRAGAAHIMQFGPVWVERPVEELMPKAPDFAEHAGFTLWVFQGR